jgi:hypothetical protein
MLNISIIILLLVVLPLLLTAIVIFFVARFVLRMMREGGQRQALLRNGESAVAEILSISDTGITVNGNPRVALRLFVQPQSRTGFEANTKLIVSRLSLAAFQPGSKIQVRFDPNDLQKVAVESTGMSVQPRSVSPLAASGGPVWQPTRATAIVLNAVEAEPAGRFKLMNLLVEVHLANRPPYQLNTKVAIAPENAPMIQPGARINATVSATDATQISLELPATDGHDR